MGLDSFATGRRANLEHVRARVRARAWARFRFLKGDIRDAATCRRACAGADFVLHQAALGSVPRSIEDPLGCHENNVTGFLNMLLAARDAGAGVSSMLPAAPSMGMRPDCPKSRTA